MPRFRGTTDGAATVVGKLLIAIASGRETSLTLSEQLGVSPRQVNRYVLQLVEAGWQIERVGIPTHSDYYFELKSPKIVIGRKRNARKQCEKENQYETKVGTDPAYTGHAGQSATIPGRGFGGFGKWKRSKLPS